MPGKINRFHILLLLVFLLALVLRFWKLGLYPEAIDEDEMAFGYYGYSLVNFGTDEYGHKLPIYFESVGDYKYGLYSYLAAIPIKVFGLNNVTTRSISALAGSLSVILIFYLVKKLSGNPTFSIISALVLALNPIHIHFSRVAYNNGLGAFFSMLAVYLFVVYVSDKRKRYLLYSFVSALLAFYTYQTYRIFLPAVIITYYLLNFKKFVKDSRINIFTTLLVSVALLSFIPAQSRARSTGMDILIDRPKLIEQYTEDGLSNVSMLSTRLLHNKYVSMSYGFINRYFSYFDPVFLFSQLSAQTERHSVPNMGVFYFFESIFFVIGLICVRKVFKGNNYLLPLIFVVAAPIAAATVVGDRSITRSMILVWGMSIFISAGVYQLLKEWKRLYIVVAFLYIGGLFYFLHQYYIHKPLHQPWYGDVGLSEMVSYTSKHSLDYRYVVISKGHYMPFIYYNKLSPDYLKNKAVFLNIKPDTGTKIQSIDNIIFNMPYDCPSAGKLNVLYACFGYRIPKNSKVVNLIRFRDNQPAVVLIEFGKTDGKLPERLEYFDNDSRFTNGILPDSYPYFWPEK
jgi:4-amino-4-deoxy-L-arabinose transferase-like glycosyltransferase